MAFSLKVLSPLRALRLKVLSRLRALRLLKALSPSQALRLNTRQHTMSMGGTIRAPRVSDLTAETRALAARIRPTVACCRQI